MVEAVIITDAGKRCNIGVEANGRKGPSVTKVSANQLLGHMERIRGATAVPAGENLTAGIERPGEKVACPFNNRSEFIQAIENIPQFRNSFSEGMLSCSG
jgi:hypothetical protein